MLAPMSSDTCAPPRLRVAVAAPAAAPGPAPRALLARWIADPDLPLPASLSRRERFAVHQLRAGYAAAFADRALRQRLRTPEEVYAVMRPLLAARPTEAIYVLPLSPLCTLTAEPILITQGDVDGVEVLQRKILRQALIAQASQILLLHNHPAGSTEPSTADRAVTRRLVEAGRLVEMPLRDHLVVTPTGFTSLYREAPDLFHTATTYSVG